MTRRPLVHFVSKPVTEPFRDGTKCLVRDIALHLRNFEPEVLGVRESEPELPGVTIRRVYSEAGGYAPGLGQNLRAALWALFVSRADLWHFVFAPNLRTSQVGSFLRAARRIPVVQTIASPPRSFDGAERLLFGDIVVAQSAHTKSRFEAALPANFRGRLVEIPPPAPKVSFVSEERKRKVRAELGLDERDAFVLYPGDIEEGEGVLRVLELAKASAEEGRSERFVLAYRDKTNRAKVAADRLEREHSLSNVRFERNASDIFALVAAASVVVFPVEELFGKVDLPIILLEAFRLGTPVIAEARGPLGSLEGARRIAWDLRAWRAELARILDVRSERDGLILEGTSALVRYEPENVASAYEDLYLGLTEKRG